MNMINDAVDISPKYARQTQLFKAISHPVRLAILDILRSGEECVCHMEALLGYRQAYLSQQLSVLREIGVIHDRRDGWNIFYHVVKPEVYEVLDAARGMLDEVTITQSDRLSSPVCPCPKCSSNNDPN